MGKDMQALKAVVGEEALSTDDMLYLEFLVVVDTLNQSMEDVILPSGLLILTLGSSFDQSMDNVTLPSGLQSLIKISAKTFWLKLPPVIRNFKWSDILSFNCNERWSINVIVKVSEGEI